MSMPFVTTQMDLTNAAAVLGSLEMDKPALVKIVVIVVVLLVLFLGFLSRGRFVWFSSVNRGNSVCFSVFI